VDRKKQGANDQTTVHSDLLKRAPTNSFNGLIEQDRERARVDFGSYLLSERKPHDPTRLFTELEISRRPSSATSLRVSFYVNLAET
jgi:hypothetical protein